MQHLVRTWRFNLYLQGVVLLYDFPCICPIAPIRHHLSRLTVSYIFFMVSPFLPLLQKIGQAWNPGVGPLEVLIGVEQGGWYLD